VTINDRANSPFDIVFITILENITVFPAPVGAHKITRFLPRLNLVLTLSISFSW
jgi:hypothetical protein